MTTTLLIARHGNTFETGQTPTRVGKHTDLPLVAKGEEQAKAIGRYLRDNTMIPDVVYTSNLKRTQQTAKIAIKESGVTNPTFALDIFDEIDYGPDENKPEADVIARIGKQAIKDWDNNAAVPDGWIVDPPTIIENWINFGKQAVIYNDNETILVVTSNGIARFAPYLTGNFETFTKQHSIKLSTGAMGILTHNDQTDTWTVQDWNIKP